jgi:hypothetical protein
VSAEVWQDVHFENAELSSLKGFTVEQSTGTVSPSSPQPTTTTKQAANIEKVRFTTRPP